MAFDTERSRVAHLLRRAGFGYSAADLDSFTALGFQATLDQLLHPEKVDNSASDQQVRPLLVDPADPDARKKIEDAKYAWLTRMLSTSRPLQEKMTLFWHTHFATANSKVGNALLMQQQIQLFRDNALGNFEGLLQKVTRDPAMLIWLDNRANRKGAPNENYAREVMELFTVGIGNYTDDDVKQAARAFTGYTLDKNLAFTFNAGAHDSGTKTFLGVTQNWDADGVLGALVRNPAHARFLSTKLFRYFVSDSPEASTIDRLADTYTRSNFDILALLLDIFSGPEFLSSHAYHAVIKQPVDYVIGSYKALNVQDIGPDSTQSLRRMGQDLLNPPDVSGWKGGATWINATTLFERFNAADKLTMGRDPKKPYYTDIPGQMTAAGVTDEASSADFWLELLADSDATPEARQALMDYLTAGKAFSLDPATLDLKGRGLVHLVMSLPSYQLG